MQTALATSPGFDATMCPSLHKELLMWKMLVGFAVFAVLAVFLLMKGGADIDMSGEKHGADAVSADHGSTAPAEAPAAASVAASVAASAASAP